MAADLAAVPLGAAALAGLAARLEGHVSTPADPSWDRDRRAWNLAVDQRPAFVVHPVGTADVQAVVAFARAHGLPVVPQGPGHGARSIASLDGAVLLRTRELDWVDVDPGARTARVGAGVEAGELVTAAAEHGLAVNVGSSPDVSFAAFAIGGGIGFLGRALGLACESLVAAEVVLADGRAVRCSETVEPELFWALRGGGGSFGVVTALEVRLHEVGRLCGGLVAWPWERAGEVLEAWRVLTLHAPDTLTTSARLLQLPPLDHVPTPFRGRALVVVDGVLLGHDDQLDALLAPLRALGPEVDTWGPVAPGALVHVHMDPPGPVPGLGDHVLLEALTPDGLVAWVDALGPGSGSPLTSAELRHLGGALARRAEGHGALGAIDAPYSAFVVGAVTDPDVTARLEAAFAAMRTAMAPWTAPTVFGPFAERPMAAEDRFTPAAAVRLRALRAQLDPAGLLQPGHVV